VPAQHLPFAVDGVVLAAVDGGGMWLGSKGEVVVGGSSVDGGGGGDNVYWVMWEGTSCGWHLAMSVPMVYLDIHTNLSVSDPDM